MLAKTCVKETVGEFEFLATLKTLKGKLARVRVVEDETSVYFELDADNDSDVIIHCFGNDDESEEYIKIRSGEVVSRRNFLYTRKYIRCQPTPDGTLKRVAHH